MSILLSQQIQTIRRGGSSVAATVVVLTAGSDSVEVPTLAANANTAIQLRRPKDPLVTVSITDIDTVALTGNIGDEILLITLHDDPIPEPR